MYRIKEQRRNQIVSDSADFTLFSAPFAGLLVLFQDFRAIKIP